MWIGIPYTKYGFNIQVNRKLIFFIFLGLLYCIISLPETIRIVGSYTDLTRHDDIESDDKYYLLIIHTFVFTFLAYVLFRFYDPCKVAETINLKPILQTKV
tara:strand:+ start:436 stop:738 length:303 start_codon:yes stop_codon:yes gene_type:complete